MKGTTYFC